MCKASTLFGLNISPKASVNLSYNSDDWLNCNSMKATKTIDASVTLPIELYQALLQQAQAHGYSLSDEITALLTPFAYADTH
ncbi:hypothetical protein NSTCB13_02799 [Nostoc sp. DSM 114160]|jgi:hypothetical protein